MSGKSDLASRAASPLDATGAPAVLRMGSDERSPLPPGGGGDGDNETGGNGVYLPLHPLCTFFPPMVGADFDGFADDIAERGLQRPIVTHEGQVLDGRNRQAACARLGLVPDYIAYDGDDPLGFVLSENLKRRHLTESQRAMVAASLVTMERGMNQHTGSANLRTRDAARKLSISERAVAAARAIRQAGAPALIGAIRDGHVSVHAGEALKTLPDPEVQRLLKAGDRAVMDAAQQLRTEKRAVAREVKMGLIAAIAEQGAITAGPGTMPHRSFPVIYADPPWKQEGVWCDANGQDKGYPYPTMTTAEIADLCAGDKSPATDDAVLFLWRTANRAPDGLKVMEAWGFEFVTELVWDKVNRGTGWWVIDCHEVLMIGKRGDFPCFLPGTQPLSLYSEPKGAHSTKPKHFRREIDRLLPDLPKLELFARGEAPEGWTFWGNESGEGSL